MPLPVDQSKGNKEQNSVKLINTKDEQQVLNGHMQIGQPP